MGQLTYFGGERDNGLTCTACNERNTCGEATIDSQNVRIQCAFRQEIDVEDNQIVLMELENGVIAHYSQCHFTPDYHRSYAFIGTKGRVESFEPMLRVEGWQKEARIEVLYRDKSTARQTFHFDLETAGHGGADLAMLQHWFHSLRSGGFDLENPLAARQSVAVGCLATESLRTDNTWKMVVSPLRC